MLFIHYIKSINFIYFYLLDDYEYNKFGVNILSSTNTHFSNCKLNKLMTPDITKLLIGSHIDNNNKIHNFKWNNVTESIYECQQNFSSDSASLTLVLFGITFCFDTFEWFK